MEKLETLIYEKEGKIAFVSLNRPQKLNAVNSQMDDELAAVWNDFKEDTNLLVAVLTGSGRAFCAGIDMAEFMKSEKGASLVHFDSNGDPYLQQGPKQCNVWKPLVLAVNGACVGGAFHFVNDADIVICSEDAWFGDAHVTVGQVSTTEPLGLSLKLPLDAVMRIALMGADERLSAQRAYQLGLVGEVLPREQLLPRATEIAKSIAKNAPLAVIGSLKAIRRGVALQLRDAITMGRAIAYQNWNNKDSQEGPRAWTEKRAPQWKGS